MLSLRDLPVFGRQAYLKQYLQIVRQLAVPANLVDASPKRDALRKKTLTPRRVPGWLRSE